MNALLDNAYFDWLHTQIEPSSIKNPRRTHWKLARQLFEKEFVWLIPNDDNRMEDGRELRYEFFEEVDIANNDPNWVGMGCSMLEMLIGLSRRLAFEADGEPRDWFWRMMDNLDLIHDTHDQAYNPGIQNKIDEIIDQVIWRTYSPNGTGGLFPLDHPEEDQRRVEIWYQLGAYISENF